jgi:DNA repair exonuclease SbcCD ATPase subunit
MAVLDKFLATFRINQEEWKDFMAIAKAEGKSASAVLVDFISWYRTGNRIAADTKYCTTRDNLTVLIDERILAKLNELETKGSQPHIDNLDNILDERERHLESRLLSILETMLEDKLEELQDNIRHIESALDNRIDTRVQALAAQQPVGILALAPPRKVEVRTMQQQELEQLQAQIEKLMSENESLLQQNQELQQELSNRASSPSPQLPDYEAVRSGVLFSLTIGKGKVATTSPQYKTAARALDKFINELQKSTPVSTPEQKNTPDSRMTWEDKAQDFLDGVKWDG